MINKMKSIVVVVAVLTLTACGNINQTAVEESSEIVPSKVKVATTETLSTSVIIQEEGKVLPNSSKELKSEEGQNLLEVMEENYDIVAKDGFISAIDKYEQNEKEGKYWLYTINGKEATVGAADYVLEDEDVIVWNLDGI